MTVSQIIACALAWTAAIVAITVLVATARRARHQPLKWELRDVVITFDRRLTAEEIEQFKAEWLRRYGARQTEKETPGA